MLTNCVPGRTTWRWYAVAALSERLQDARPKAPPGRPLNASKARLQDLPLPNVFFFALCGVFERGVSLTPVASTLCACCLGGVFPLFFLGSFRQCTGVKQLGGSEVEFAETECPFANPIACEKQQA